MNGMTNEFALIGLLHAAARPERMTQFEGAALIPPPEQIAPRFALRQAMRRWRDRLRLWRRRAAESHELEAMTDRDLRDFGISRYDATQAARGISPEAPRHPW